MEHASIVAFRAEYDRLNGSVYAGALPPFPGVELVDSREIFSLTRTRGARAWRRLEPFVLSVHVSGALLTESIRHEVAHVAAMFLDEDEGHGPAWERHARLVGASGLATLDEGHPLREQW